LALDASVRSDSVRHLSQGRQATQALINDIRVSAIAEVRKTSELSIQAFQLVKSEARSLVSQANQDVPMHWSEISLGAKHALRSTRFAAHAMLGGVLEQARRDALRAKTECQNGVAGVAASAELLINKAASRSEALMREIAGQGPEKTLRRGFAVVRDGVGKPIARVAQAKDAVAIDIQFFDGRVSAAIEKQL
jgi:exodeoxyribonuclease VII large subunit